MAELVRVASDVSSALEGRRPVVAFETTLIAHGFPEGRGAEVAREATERIRAAGAVPAVVGIVDGVVRVGLEDDELDRFAASPDARRVGPRDLAPCIISGELGATTVGGTLAVCRAVGVGFLATGGIGGVHRGYGSRLDVSADLFELAATSEVLETLGIPVLGWQTDTLPLFYSADGGPPVSQRVETADEAAQLARLHWSLVRHSAILLARPPSESLDVEPLVARVIEAAEHEGVRGTRLTPFLLGRLHAESEGATVELNARLVAENSALAAEVAVAYARLH
ncbi:MAG: pseudouridine-5'-phosphate glycosidase [Actinobacteria bacterium]|nr:MAG: pseudouridine-5'-phosphate glycosidase [Actinomycetota bacterium]